MSIRSTRIGIIGGGQLGQMLAQAAVSFGHFCNILDKSRDCPAAPLAKEFIQGELTDSAALSTLAAISDVVTYEIEHINIDVLLDLESQGKEIIPSPRVLEIIKDKGRQKEFLRSHNIPTSPFVIARDLPDVNSAVGQLGSFRKHVGKSCTGGYDGRGVYIFEGTVKRFPLHLPAIIEGFVECEKELAVIVGRSVDGNSATYPVAEMVFNPKANLVDYLVCPADIPSHVEEEAKRIANETVRRLDGVGIFAIEMFLDHSDKLFVNEIAPRPHNSGHHTIEACATSQYEQLLRILLRLPLGSTALLKPSVMFNIVGPEGVTGAYEFLHPEKIFSVDGAFLHLYGKKETRPHRKLGHITILGDTIEELLSKLETVRTHTQIIATTKKTTA